jgi:hypothetical protein
MTIDVGTTLYRYTVKDCKLVVREGIVNHYGLRTCVNFKDGSAPVRCPRPEDIGVMRTVGHSIWLTERDDDRARQMYIDFEEGRIAELQGLIDRKRKVVEGLRSL